MAHIDHGNWLAYAPNSPPKDAPLHAMFARRESDGVDWYEFIKGFGLDTVKFAADMRDGVGYVVGPAVYDATKIFPAGCIVREIPDYTGSDPQADFGSKLYDPATETFSEIVRPPAKGPTLADLAARITALEGSR